MEDNFFKFSNLSKFPEIVHGISTREFGNMKYYTDNEQVLKNREKFCEALEIELDSLVAAENIHSHKVAVVSEQDRGKGARTFRDAIKGVDGLITDKPNINIIVTMADCLPILVYDPVLKIVGVAHAGWRGVLEDMAGELIEAMKRQGSTPDNLVIGVGPSICQKHFIVKKDVREKFYEKYPKSVFVRNHDGYIDLKKCVVDQLLAKSISKSNLEVAHECTVCNNYYFSSFRQEGVATKYMAALIGLRG